MNIKEKILANRYAQAFLNIYADNLNLDDYYHIKNAYQFLKNNDEINAHFKLPNVENAKKETIKEIFEEFHLPESLYELVDLLIKHQRLFLLKKILFSLLGKYCERKKYMFFSFESSHALTSNQCKAIENFLEKKTKKTILYNETINKNLIAGIRLLSDSLLWEHSVAKQLRKAEHILRSKERL